MKTIFTGDTIGKIVEKNSKQTSENTPVMTRPSQDFVTFENNFSENLLQHAGAAVAIIFMDF